MIIVAAGINLTKTVFAIHGVDEGGKAVLMRPNVARGKLLELMVSLLPCLFGVEACSGAHRWVRQLQKLGHITRMAPKFVPPYCMGGKHGKNDAAAICEAVRWPGMHFAPIKGIDEQGQLMVHRARQGFVRDRTALINRICGLLSELASSLPLKAQTQTARRQAQLHLDGLAVGRRAAHARHRAGAVKLRNGRSPGGARSGPGGHARVDARRPQAGQVKRCAWQMILKSMRRAAVPSLLTATCTHAIGRYYE